MVAAAFACLIGILVAIAQATPADGANAREIGKTRKAPGPSCPTPSGNPPARKQCQVIASVTSFQKKADGKQGLMRVPAHGHIVGWAVDLSRPSKGEKESFIDRYNFGEPSARISMLTRANDKNKYRLRAQTPKVRLKGMYGQLQYLTLRNPIEVQEGWITGLTTDNWAPNFAHDLRAESKQNVWKASRTRKRCAGLNDLLRSKPHKDPGSTRAYGCEYKDSRVLYWAYFRAS